MSTAPVPSLAVPAPYADAPAAPAPAPQKQQQKSLRALALRGSAWTMVGFGGGQVLRFAGNIVLTRLLFPEAFGLMALVGTFIQGVQMFSDVGILPSIIQNPRGDDPDFLRTAWTIQSIRGVGLFVVSAIIAYPVALLYHQPMLAWLIPVAGLAALIAGFNSVSLCTYNRKLAIGRLTMVELASSVASLLFTIALAWHFRSVWALVIGGLAGGVARLVLSHVAMPSIRHYFQWDRESADALFRFGRWVFLSTVLTFFALQTDRLLFGAKIPMALLGVYSVALTLASVPASAIVKVSVSVVFPAYTRRSDDPAYLPTVFHRLRAPLLAAGGLLVTGLIATGPALIHLVYDDRYTQAGILTQLLAVAVWFQIIEATYGCALLAIAKANWIAACNAAKIVAMCTVIPLGFYLGRRYGTDPAGFLGAVAALAMADFVRYAVAAHGLSRTGLRGWTPDILFTLGVAVIAALGLFVDALLRARHAPRLAVFLIAGTVVTAAWAPVLLWTLRQRRAVR